MITNTPTSYSSSHHHQQQHHHHSSTFTKKRSRPFISSTDITPHDHNHNDDTSAVSIDEANAFYLKHQNRALASELHDYKYALTVLEKERWIRRKECRNIAERLGDIQTLWKQLECFLLVSLQDLGVNFFNSLKPNWTSTTTDAPDRLKDEASPTPPSTGASQDVESISNIISIITSLSQPPLISDWLESRKNTKQFPNQHPDEGPQKTISSSSIEPHSMMNLDDNHHQSSSKDQTNAEPDQTKNSENKQVMDDDDNESDTEDDDDEEWFQSLSQLSSLFSQRCIQFQQLLLEFMHQLWNTRQQQQPQTTGEPATTTNANSNDIFEITSLQKQLTSLQSQYSNLQCQLDEMAKSRDDANQAEKKLRVVLYRFVTGRISEADVKKAMQASAHLSDLQALEDRLNSTMTAITSSASSAANMGYTQNISSTSIDGIKSENPSLQKMSQNGAIEIDGKSININDVIQMKKTIADLTMTSESRETKISELIAIKEEQEKQINVLLSKGEDNIPDEKIKGSHQYIQLALSLKEAESNVQDLMKELQSVKERWAATKGDLELTRKGFEDLEEKNNRRLKELLGDEYSDGISKEAEDSNGQPENTKIHIEHAKTTIELEHKLKHALDNVRQVESIRTSLSEAMVLNEVLQQKVEELQTKNSILVATEAAAHANVSGETGDDTASPASSKNTPFKDSIKDGPYSSKDSSLSSLQDKIRRMKKELSAATSAKDQAKAKQDRAEKERDVLMKTNSRLLKQSMEKDDMNAKSLSTILHLKQLSEQLELEKEILEKKVKGNQQLALAARLAANAKERVEEEAMREKVAIEEALEKAKIDLKTIEKEKKELENELVIKKISLDKLVSNINVVTERCNHLVQESSKREKERIQLDESLMKAKNEVADHLKRAKAAENDDKKGDKVDSSVRVEHLNTYVNSLKSRIVCPVCNTRDKQVIIMRCRHMFCRQCIDTNIENRNRKCPGCGQKFSGKDISDIWL
jgi:E3 ubiquitin-protein ligase BRE1